MAVYPVANASSLRQPETKKSGKTPERSGSKKFNSEEALAKILEDKDNRAFLKKKTPKENLPQKIGVPTNTAPLNQKGKHIDEMV